MSFFKYLKDNKKLLALYFILMSFISLTIYFDRNNRVLGSDLLYIEFVSLIIFILYLLFDYYSKKKHIKILMEFQKSKDKTPILPPPIESKDEIYTLIINDIYNDYLEKLDLITSDASENQEFMTSWVHEIKTPITTSKLLMDTCTDNLSKKDLSSLREELLKIDDYVEKALYYSRTDSFSKDYVIGDVNINKLIKESIKKHSIIFIKKNIKLNLHISDECTAYSDKKWLLFIIDQIISNALKYTNHNGIISFYSKENDLENVLLIEDNGCGIKKEDMGRLFTKSFTGQNGRMHNIKATGFGLYLSQKLAKKLGHFITIESEYKKGTKVYIHFPKYNDYYDITKM